MTISTDLVKHLRQLTGSSIGICKKVLEETGGNMEMALALLKKSSEAFASKKSERVTNAGIIESYVHGNRRIGVLLELRCETDFVARNPEFQTLAHDIALHIAGVTPLYEGKIEAHFRENSLLSQPFVKNPLLTIEELIQQHIAHFGENITIERFARFEI